MVKPKFVLASAAVVAPVPPLAITISVALHTPDVIVPTLVKLEPVIVEANVVPVKVPALTVDKFAFTYSVVASVVELSLVAAVGAVGVPVNAGEAKGAFNNMLAVFVVILDVFAAIALVFDVILAVFAATFVFSVAMLAAFEVMLAVFAAIAVVLFVINPGKVVIVAELTPPTEFTVVAKLPFPEPVTSPVKVVVKFAAITSVPITKPKFVLAPAAVVAPVPPFKTARLPLIFAEVILLSATPAFALC
jgi:hypothetical protein